MLTDRDLRELLSYKSESPVLSVYLNTDPTEGSAETYKLHLRSMLKEVDLPEDVLAVLGYFDREHDWSGRSVAVFSCAPERFMRTYSIAVPVRSRVRYSSRPYVKPLADLLDSYGGYGVVLVDKQGARLFYFHLGELREEEGVKGESVRRTKRGGGSQAVGRRGGTAGQTDYVDEVAERNIKEVVETANRFFTENHIRRILIGGTEDNVALFRSQLPKAWQSLVVGVFPISMVASHNEILARAMEVGKEAQNRRQAELVKKVLTSTAKERGGVVNLEDTLKAIHEGRVQTLLICEGFRAPGSRCTSCGFLSAEIMDVCPYCGGEPEEIPDAVELAVRRVMLSGGEVEVLRAGYTEGGFENIGALLHY
jgi:peptide subunit release factor 1 (eRF1)